MQQGRAAAVGVDRVQQVERVVHRHVEGRADSPDRSDEQPTDLAGHLPVERQQRCAQSRVADRVEPQLHPGDKIVIDFGTATTFDVVDWSGAYKGGIIAPGINLSLDALVAAAAKLPRIAIEAPANATVIGRTTASQMLSGIYWGYVAMIEGLLARVRAEIGRPVTVIATGGLSIPKIGATDFGYRVAAQFGLRMVAPRAALVPLTFDGAAWAPFAQLAGLALPVLIEAGDVDATPKQRKKAVVFAEDLLFTHKGLSGPAVLQISSFWRSGQGVRVNLAPGIDMAATLLAAKSSSKKLIANELASVVPSRLADAWAGTDAALQRPIVDATDKALLNLADRLADWRLTPTGSEGYKKAEVTAGGVDTRDLSSRTMESRQPGLYFIGEVVDVTGWLGGYNFQWAWASGFACANALVASK